MIDIALTNHISTIERNVPRLRGILEKINDPTNLVLQQATCLMALCLELKPEVIIDLGTGNGNSAATFALATSLMGGTGRAIVHTFDMQSRWKENAIVQLRDEPEIIAGVIAHIGDLTEFDFLSLLRGAKSTFIFWDAHGFTIADVVLSKILPLVANERHLVVCHDVSDNRYLASWRSYESEPLWRGMDYYYATRPTARVNLGWVNTIVDQFIPIIDFCARNEIELKSVDDIINKHTPAHILDRFAGMLGGVPNVSMAYFSMEGTTSRHFPVDEKQSQRQGLALLWAGTAGSTVNLFSSFSANCYGGEAPRVVQRADALIFSAATVRDHFAGQFFETRPKTATRSSRSRIVVELDWPQFHGKHPTLLLQSPALETFGLVEPAQSAGSTPMVIDRGLLDLPDRLRAVLIFPETGEYVLPNAIRVYCQL